MALNNGGQYHKGSTMEAKYLTSVESNEELKGLFEKIESLKKNFHAKIDELNNQGNEAQQAFQKEYDEAWGEIAKNLHEQGLVTAEESKHGMFLINKHNQVFFDGMKPTGPATELKAVE